MQRCVCVCVCATVNCKFVSVWERKREGAGRRGSRMCVCMAWVESWLRVTDCNILNLFHLSFYKFWIRCNERNARRQTMTWMSFWCVGRWLHTLDKSHCRYIYTVFNDILDFSHSRDAQFFLRQSTNDRFSTFFVKFPWARLRHPFVYTSFNCKWRKCISFHS